jgi:DUF4097 and DUF4098 domain-containing protein YvlB
MLATALLALTVLAPTDQTVPVQKGTKLDVSNFAGDVNVKTWDKDAVRVEVNHSDREIIDIKPADQVLTIRSRSTRGGPPRSLDYTISVPSWMAITVAGTYADVTLDGVGGDVSVDTTRGDIVVHGGSGFVSLKSVQGEITLEKARGRVEARSINESIHLADISGDLSAETTNGSIILDRIDSSNVDLYTVNGNILYDGPIKDKGAYRLTTHNGTIAMAVPEKVNATLLMRTYNGDIRSTFPLKSGDEQERRKRLTLTLGTGSAHIELESFGGTIALRRPGEARPDTERRHRGGRDTRKDEGLVPPDLQASIDSAMASLPEAIDEAMASLPAAMDEAMASLPAAIDGAMAGMPAAIDQALAAAHDAMSTLRVHPVPHPRPRPRQ